MKEYKGFEGHIILYCKGHYKYNDFLVGLRRIWAIRCGYDYNPIDKSSDRAIADCLYNLVTDFYDIERIQHKIHIELSASFYTNEYKALEILILLYRSLIHDTTIKENRNGRYYSIIKLPKPMVRLFNRIIEGNGKYTDYELIKYQDEKKVM